MRTLTTIITLVVICLLSDACWGQTTSGYYGPGQCNCYACQLSKRGQAYRPIAGCSCSLCCGTASQPICPPPCPPASSPVCAPVCPAPRPAPCPASYPAPCETPCGSGPECDSSGRFGLMFDWGVRFSSMVNGVDDVPAALRTLPGNVVVDPDNVEIGPTFSLLLKGIGFSTGDPDCGQFRIGARPEVVLSPHSSSETNIFNWGLVGTRTKPLGRGNYANAYYGAQCDDWVVPEYLMEYQKRPWTFGLAYKIYHMSLTKGFSNSEDEPTMIQKYSLGNLQTFTLYGRYKGFELGYNFFSNSRTTQAGPKLGLGVPVTLGYSF